MPNAKRIEIHKIAEEYVVEQLKNLGARNSKVSKRDLRTAISKVSEALAEIRSAYSTRRIPS